MFTEWSSTSIEYSIRYNQVSSSHSAINALKLIQFAPAASRAGANTKTTTWLSAMSSARRRKSSADDDLSVVVASQSVEMLGNDADDERRIQSESLP
jgi:hypothetical protein